MKRLHFHKRGFTTIELMVVVLLMSIIAAVTFPRLYPAIAFTTLEGSAKHLGNYGRSAMAEAIMLQQDITVRIDLDEQSYAASRWVDPRDLEEQERKAMEGEEDMLGRLSELKADPSVERFGGRGTSPRQLAGTGKEYQRYMATFESFFGDIPEDFDTELADRQMMDRFDRFERRLTLARAANVKHEKFLDEFDLFGDKDFELDADSEPVEMEVENPILLPVNLPSGVKIEAVCVDGVTHKRGVVEIELSPIGLSSKVGFHVVNEDGDYYTVHWDPTLGGAKIRRGKEPIDE